MFDINELLFLIRNFFFHKAAERKAIQKVDSNPKKIIYLSNLQRSKGIEDVIWAANLLKAKFPNCNFQINVYGKWRDLTTKTKCAKLIKNNNLPILFHPPVHSVKKFNCLAESDIFVFPPREPEGHPWVIVEAMAAGLPIISTDQGAISESVIDGVNGFIVEKQNPKQIAEKVKLLIEDFELRKKMGKASRRLYLENFTEEKTVQKMVHAFSTVLSK